MTSKPDNVSQADWDAVDFPEVPSEMIARMKPSRRGRGPQNAPTKEKVTLRLDADVVEHFKRGGKGWTSRLNAALRTHVDT